MLKIRRGTLFNTSVNLHVQSGIQIETRQKELHQLIILRIYFNGAAADQDSMFIYLFRFLNMVPTVAL